MQLLGSIGSKRGLKSRPLLWGAIAGMLLGSFSDPAQARDLFGNGGIEFDVDTIVEFEFAESNGAFQSTFGVINLDTGVKTPLLVEVKPSDRSQTVERPSTYTDDTGQSQSQDFLGTPGNTVPQPLVEFEFEANTRYALYLESSYNGRPVNLLYSTDAQNPNSRRQAEFRGDFSALANGEGALIRWDDTGEALVRDSDQDRDFDDFIVIVGGYQDCPYDEISEFDSSTSR
ncbi:hypothetical protein JJD41_00705 [Oxynema sp. CENA135]|uniref:hypothetical protein n=1 Tax=Oxynema sp. CENA135 TaxID=984206 RepID=UPI00190A24E6|nr:hypothetical protein [Oxynema sp. CENA135]MBK4728412.1 hypothetical protein [Oxynema sp. CENA135]